MKYADLQKEAAALGIKAVGVKQEVLAKQVEEAKGSQPEPETEPTPKVEADANTAIVYNKNTEIRRYTKTLHGADFVELAQEFASKRGYRVEFANLQEGVCPTCGRKL